MQVSREREGPRRWRLVSVPSVPFGLLLSEESRVLVLHSSSVAA